MVTRRRSAVADGGRDTWYARVDDADFACEQVARQPGVVPGSKIVACRQMTEAQVDALRIAPGELRQRVHAPTGTPGG